MEEIKTIFWDFDGVILDSNHVREQGFREVLKEYPKDQVEQLIAYHSKNGGLSRYVKFRYFLEEILSQEATDLQIERMAMAFSQIMKELLVDKENLIQETVNFIRKNHHNYRMFVTSGSDQKELRFLCVALELSTYFEGIYGSPKPKTIWIKELLEQHQLRPNECVIIGDSINDYEAGMDNHINFMAYNNDNLIKLNTIEPIY